MRSLERRDLALVPERQPDVVEPVEKAVPLERIEPKGEGLAAGGDRLLLEVDSHLRSVLEIDEIHETTHLFGLERDRHETDLHAVRDEDVRERRRHDDLVARVLERPGRVLPGRSAAEVASCQQDAGSGKGRVVELEVRILAPRSEERRVGKEWNA